MKELFMEILTKELEERLGEEYVTQIHHVMKNNGMGLEGLAIMKKGENSSPTIYLEEYFETYQSGETISSIASRIIAIYKEAKKKEEKELLKKLSADQLTYEIVEEDIVCRLVNYEKNKDMLQRIPHKKFLDLAVTFHILLKREEDSIGTIRITREIFDNWQISEELLWDQALRNTLRLFPIQIRSMKEVMMGFLLKKMPEDEVKDLLIQEVPSLEMYIMTNIMGINGAATLLYETELQKFANSLQSDFYILPSSIHEVILVPYQEHFIKEDFCRMVCDVNRTQVPVEDILSNHVYLYKRETGTIEM